MKTDTFMNAVGMIDDRFLDVEIPGKNIVYRKWRKRLVSAAAVAALLVCPFPALTALGVDAAYDVLYNIAPGVAQTFKPVQKSCIDSGIEMTVISAERSGSEASVYLAMHDTTGTCPDGNWDLFDSYNINVSRDMSGHCSFSDYDPDTHTAYFVVHLQTMDGSDMPRRKVTFSVSELLVGKQHTEGTVEGVDMKNIPYEPPTTIPTDFRGMDDIEGYRFLLPSEQALSNPAPGVSVLNAGYIDGAFHILTRYDDIIHTDNHGFMMLVDNEGNTYGDDANTKWFDYWDGSYTDSFTEQVIQIDYDKLAGCTLQGDFVTCQNHISGDWQVTFPLE